MNSARLTCFSALSLLAASLLGCGGSSSSGGGSTGTGGGTTTPPPPPPTGFAITTSTLPKAVDGTPYSVQLAAANGSGQLTWTLSQVPPGLTLSPAGLLSGTPTSSFCDFPLTATVTDSATPAHTATSSLRFNAEGVNGISRSAQVGVYFGDSYSVICPIEPISWSVTAGSLPPGLVPQPFPGEDNQLNLNGAPTQAGDFAFTIQAVDGAGHTLPVATSLHVLPLQLVVTDSLMQLGVVNQPYTHPLSTAGGTPPYTFTITSGSLPAGLQLNPVTGVITGTPTASGLSTFTINIADSTTPGAFTVNKPDSILITPAALPARNDSIATATPIVPGSYNASLSPYTDAAGNPAPDQDFFVLQGAPGDTFSIGVTSYVTIWDPTSNTSTPLTSPIDPALELLDASGQRLATCSDRVADNPPAAAPYTKGGGNFTDPCISHDTQLPAGSSLTLRLGSGQPFYVHVFDFLGRARPDLLYSLFVQKQ